jgi:plastocyanin
LRLAFSEAPVRRSLRAGACVLAVLALAACDRAGLPGRDEGPRVLELEHETIRLDAGQRLVQVQVRRTAAGDFEPDIVEANVGDYVRFTAGDGAGHAIAFVGTALPPQAREFLDSTGQVRSPPLITADASWVITLEGAPPGDYPFHCTTHNAPGRLQVRAP